MSPIFIIGTGRCGTTLLAKLLQGAKFKCLLEQDVPSRLPSHNNQHLFNLLYSGEISQAGFKRLFRSQRELQAPHYCEKIPHAQWAIPLIWDILPEAKFIELYREGRDTVQSMLNASWYADKRPRWEPREGWDRQGQFKKCCIRYKYTIAHTIHNILTASRYLPIKYERLVTQTEDVLTEIEKFIGLELERGIVDIKPSIGNSEGWSEKQGEIYRDVMGEAGMRGQAFLGY